MKRMHAIIPRLARVLFVAALAFTLFMALDPAPPHLAIDRWGDKAEHMLAFGTMAGLARLGFTRLSGWLLLEHLSFLGAMIEVLQAMPAVGRDCDWKDWLADTIAAGLAILVVDRLRRYGVLPQPDPMHPAPPR